jgi:diguanylate cyclase (GGDEF)-like protein
MPDKEIDQLAILKSVLNGLEAIICVCELETFEILFLNDSIKNYFNIRNDVIGQKCHKVLQGLDQPCPTCPYNQLLNAPEKVIQWEHVDRIKGNILHKTAKIIDWVDGRKAHLEYAVDITELRHTQERVVHLESKAEKIYYDPLTGIYNRRYFVENMEILMHTLSRSGSQLSLLMVDVDFFKKYNDIYGHIQGDECLKSIAEIIHSNTTRKDDFVARYGGEEFVIVLPNTDSFGARVIAERMIDDIRNHNIPHIGNDDEKHVTISIGIVTGIPKTPLSIQDFVRRADDMMYESKRNGRNRYSFTEI